MSQNQDDILDRLNNSIAKCRRAAGNFEEAISNSSEQDSLPQLPDLTDYRRHYEARRQNGHLLLTKQISKDNTITSNTSNANVENSDPNSFKPAIRNCSRK